MFVVLSVLIGAGTQTAAPLPTLEPLDFPGIAFPVSTSPGSPGTTSASSAQDQAEKASNIAPGTIGPTSTPPAASFSIGMESGTAPFLVKFTNTSQGPITALVWDFGDGTTSRGESPTHRYTIAGTYSIKLLVSGPGGLDTRVMADLVTVKPGQATKVVISPATAPVSVQEGIQFTAVAQDDFGNVTPATFDWAMAGEVGSITVDGFYTADILAGTFADSVVAWSSAVAGDGAGTASVIVKPGAVSRVSVEPPVIAVEIEDSQAFTVLAHDKFGNQISDFMTSWSVRPKAGGIDENGVLTTGTDAGLFLDGIRVDVVWGGGSVSAASDLVIISGPLTTVQMTPSSIDIKKGDQHQFEARGFDKYGNEVPPERIRWRASGGSITQQGLFTASRIGPYQVCWELYR